MKFFVNIKSKVKEVYSKLLAKLYRAISAYYLRKEQKAAQRKARKNAKMEQKLAKKAFESKSADFAADKPTDKNENPASEEFADNNEKVENSATEETVASDLKSEEVNSTNEASSRAKVIAKVKLAFLNFFDVIFEVLFFCAMIFCLIPQIFENSNITKVKFFSGTLYYRAPDEIIGYTDFAICVIASLIVFYVFYKTFFALKMAEGKNKAISILCLLALVLAGLPLGGKTYWIFIVIYFILFFAFELSCSVKIKLVIKKLICILLLNFIMSGVILYLFDIRFKDSVSEFVQMILRALNIC